MTISLFWKVKNLLSKMVVKTMLCKLETQSFQALAPLSKVEPFGREGFSALISVEEVGRVGGVVACSVP